MIALAGETTFQFKLSLNTTLSFQVNAEFVVTQSFAVKMLSVPHAFGIDRAAAWQVSADEDFGRLSSLVMRLGTCWEGQATGDEGCSEDE